jgi:hypothetical protein
MPAFSAISVSSTASPKLRPKGFWQITVMPRAAASSMYSL